MCGRRCLVSNAEVVLYGELTGLYLNISNSCIAFLNVAVGVVVEASTPTAYWRVVLVSASTLSRSVVRTLRGEEGLPKMVCLVASSLGHLRSQYSIVCGPSFLHTQWVCR